MFYQILHKQDKQPRLLIPLEGLQLKRNIEFKGKFVLELMDPSQKHVKAVKLGSETQEAKHEVYRLAAESEEDLQSWVEAIRGNMIISPVLMLINQKKLQMAKTKTRS
jgi:hypothetical protein